MGGGAGVGRAAARPAAAAANVVGGTPGTDGCVHGRRSQDEELFHRTAGDDCAGAVLKTLLTATRSKRENGIEEM
jgi:hypothetical protein